MSARGARRASTVATGIAGVGTSVVRLAPASAGWRNARWRTPTATLSDRTHWIAWRPYTNHVATPVGVVQASTSWGTPHAILYVTPGASAVIRPSHPRAHSRFATMSASRLATLRSAIRRLAIRAAVVRSSGIN